MQYFPLQDALLRCFAMLKLILFVILLLSFPFPCAALENSNKDFYKLEMQRLIGEVRTAAKAKNPSFGVICNGGTNLYNPLAYSENNDENAKKALKLVDGVLIESLNFGYNYNDDTRTPNETRQFLLASTEFVKKHGIVMFNIDYCSKIQNKILAALFSKKDGFIYFSAKRGLDELRVTQLNEKSITCLRDCKNFCVLLNPHKFLSKEIYLDKLKKSNYDLLILDGYFGGNFLHRDDVSSLKHKPNGERRLIYCYMSIGEAEPYRWYWEKSYETALPEWIAGKNENWGSYKIKYWLEPWHKIIYSGDNSYLSQILNAGFDGVFLDVIDSFAYFEELENRN